MKTHEFSLLTVCGILAASLSLAGADTPQNAAPTATTQYVMPRSAGVDEVVKLAKAGVGEPVVLTYVQTASVAYHPSVDEIIQLRADGVSDKVITAMLQRGGEVRDQMAQASYAPAVAQPVSQAPMVTQPAIQPTVVYSQPQPVYADSTPNVVYIGQSYPTYPVFSYAGCYGFPGFYGGYCGPRFSPRFYGVGHFGGAAHFGGVGHFGGGHFGGAHFSGGGSRRGR